MCICRCNLYLFRTFVLKYSHWFTILPVCQNIGNSVIRIFEYIWINKFSLYLMLYHMCCIMIPCCLRYLNYSWYIPMIPSYGVHILSGSLNLKKKCIMAFIRFSSWISNYALATSCDGLLLLLYFHISFIFPLLNWKLHISTNTVKL